MVNQTSTKRCAPINGLHSAVGYQATTSDGKTEQPNVVLEGLIRVVRPTGGLGIPGLYVPSDPGAPDSASAKCAVSALHPSSMLIAPFNPGGIFHSHSVS
jgi:hypothetical protein